jgi:2',3'-cyclic-nucleotide 2'-phosphodiesterase
MKILAIGDVFGRPGRHAVQNFVPKMIAEEQVEFVIANGENMAGGKGMTPETCQDLFDAGVDVITSGNHARDQKQIDPLLDSEPRLLRPMNYPTTYPGRGHVVEKARNGTSVAVINSMGLVHMAKLDSPFVPTLKLAEEMKKFTPIVIVDFHAEATSEKRAMGWYLNGQVSAVVGTHSHVQTADEEILNGGTAYITDLGMTGPYESVIGLRIDLAFDRFLKSDRSRFDVGKKDVRLCGALIQVDEVTGKANSIERVLRKLPDL